MGHPLPLVLLFVDANPTLPPEPRICTRSQPRPLQLRELPIPCLLLRPTSMHMLRTGFSCYSSECYCLNPHHWPQQTTVHTHGQYTHTCVQPQECTPTTNTPQQLAGPDSALSPVTGLQHCTPAASSSSCALAKSQSTPCHCLHCYTLLSRTSRHSSVHQQPGSLQLPVSPHLAPALTLAPTNTCVWKQPLLLHRHLGLAPQPSICKTTGSSHHCSFPFSLATIPRVTAEDLNSHCSHYRTPAVVKAEDLKASANESPNPPHV